MEREILSLILSVLLIVIMVRLRVDLGLSMLAGAATLALVVGRTPLWTLTELGRAAIASDRARPIHSRTPNHPTASRSARTILGARGCLRPRPNCLLLDGLLLVHRVEQELLSPYDPGFCFIYLLFCSHFD